MDLEALVDDVSPVMQVLGAAFYFTPETLARGKDLGLDGFRFYFLGRGGVLGDVEPPVVQSAFGYFQRDLVAKIWTTARARTTATPREVGAMYMAASQDFGRLHFHGL